MATTVYRLCTQYECHLLRDLPAYFAQAIDEELEIVIRCDATDEQLIKLSDRFDVPLDEMKAFRETRALPRDANMINAADYVSISRLGEESAQPTAVWVNHG